MELAEKITNAELEVMRILWRENKPLSFTEIRIELHNSKKWEKSTINTLIRRLVKKNIISVEKLEVAYYTPNITEEEFIKTEETNMLNKLYGGSAKKFVAAMYNKGQLSEEDIDELKEYFKMGENKDE